MHSALLRSITSTPWLSIKSLAPLNVLDSPTMSHFEGLPLIRVNNFFQLSEHHLITVLDEVKDKKRNLEKITKSYWKQEILNGH